LLFLLSLDAKAQTDADFVFDVGDSSALRYILPTRIEKSLPKAGNENLLQDRYKQALKNNNERVLLVTSSNLGMNSLKKKDPIKAIQYFKKALSYAENLQNKKAILTSHIQIAIAFVSAKKYDDALASIQQAEKILPTAKAGNSEGIVYAVSAYILKNKKELTTASEYFLRASKSYTAKGEKVAAAGCLNALGEIQLKLNASKESLESFSSAWNLISSSKENKIKALVLRNEGLVYFKKGMFEKAVEFFNKSVAFDNQLIVKKLLKDAYMQLFTVNGFSNNFTKADYYHELYRSLKDSLLRVDLLTSKRKLTVFETEEKIQIIEMLQRENQAQAEKMNQQQLELSQVITKSDFELQQKDQALEEKENELSAMSKEKAEKERDIARKELLITRQNSFRNLLIGVTIVAFLFIFLFYNRYKIKRDSNKNLQKANQELAETLEQLKSTQNQLVQSEKMASLGQLTAGIAHEIQNPLNFVNNFSETSIELFDELKNASNDDERNAITNDLKLIIGKINHHGKRAEQIVKNMLLHSRTGSTEKELVDINDLCDEISGLAFHGARVSMPTLQCKLEKNYSNQLPKVKINRQDIGRVLLNIMSNGFYALNVRKKQSENNYLPELTVSTNLHNNQIEVRIQDNGTGMPPEVRNKIFEPFFTTKPTGEGTGLGLSMSYDIITKEHQGQIKVESEVGAYTAFIIHLPITA
jgi:two-component system, NtrC family, sensor kinase